MSDEAAAERWSLDVGRVGGVPVAVHASWLVAFGLMSGVLAGGLLPLQSPGWATATYWVVGAATSALLFAGLLLHELAHCWVARRQGLAVHRVTLFVLGGVSEIGGEPESPGTALRIALAGPLTSFALAALCAAAAALARGADVVAAPLTLLAQLNGVLGAFNLLPGHPLDGGRVLHAAVWLATGDRERATLVSARAGRWISLGIAGAGVVLLLQGAIVGLWLVIIGWFQHATAVATAERLLLRRALAGTTVAQVMGRGDVRVSPGMPLDRLVAQEMLEHGERCVIVTDDGQLRGLVTLRDLHAVPRERWAEVGVEAVMRPAERLLTTTPEELLVDAVRCMDDAQVAQLPVIAGGRVAGLLTREQVLHHVRARLERRR
jgi:Zn-dependent protease